MSKAYKCDMCGKLFDTDPMGYFLEEGKSSEFCNGCAGKIKRFIDERCYVKPKNEGKTERCPQYECGPDGCFCMQARPHLVSASCCGDKNKCDYFGG